MICVFCKGKVVKKKVQEEVKAGNDYILVEVDAEICENFHETYFPQSTVDYLLDLRKKLKGSKDKLKTVGKVFRAA